MLGSSTFPGPAPDTAGQGRTCIEDLVLVNRDKSGLRFIGPPSLATTGPVSVLPGTLAVLSSLPGLPLVTAQTGVRAAQLEIAPMLLRNPIIVVRAVVVREFSNFQYGR